MKHYRALISVPISANSDDHAWTQAVKYAHSLMDDNCVVGHVEQVAECENGSLTTNRVVYRDSGLTKQI